MGSIRIQRVSVEYPVESRGMRRILNDLDLEIENGSFDPKVTQYTELGTSPSPSACNSACFTS